MPAYSIEQILLEGQAEVKELFGFVKDNAETMDAYTIEQNIFFRILASGLSAMKSYFSEKGTTSSLRLLHSKPIPNMLWLLFS